LEQTKRTRLCWLSQYNIAGGIECYTGGKFELSGSGGLSVANIGVEVQYAGLQLPCCPASAPARAARPVPEMYPVPTTCEPEFKKHHGAHGSPGAEGVNVTDSVQLPPAGSVVFWQVECAGARDEVLVRGTQRKHLYAAYCASRARCNDNILRA